MDMIYGRETFRHGHWKRDTMTLSMVEGHLSMDTGRGSLGHG